jgi:hypothetical protein
MAHDSWDVAAARIVDFVRENEDEMGWVSCSAIAAGTGLTRDQIIDEVETLCATGLFACRLRWCTPARSWSP